MAARWRCRWRLRGARRHLAKLETELGVLGWQQAEFDPQTQGEVDKILHAEREQSRLTSESAAIVQAIADLKAEREEARLAHEQKSAPLAAEGRTIRENIEKAGAQIAQLRRQVADLESREPRLDRELREVSRAFDNLLAKDAQTPEMRDQQAELRERIKAIPGEIAESQTRRSRAVLEIDELQKSVARENARKAALAGETRELESAQSAEDRKLADAISKKEGEREIVHALNARLEKDKANPYREIGRVLADSGVPPMNQPHALDAVRAGRLHVMEIEHAITQSRAESDAGDRTLTQHSLMVLSAVAVAVLLILGALIRW